MLKTLMANQAQEARVFDHYNHTDLCNRYRWTARECYQFMYARPWRQVLDFYTDVVNRRLPLSALSGVRRHVVNDGAEILEATDGADFKNSPDRERTGRWARITFKLVLSYCGSCFDGWQKQPGLRTVQGLVEQSLGRFVDEKKAKQLKEKCLPIEGCAVVAGRTDKGVTAFQQVCSFYTWRKDVKAQAVENAINNAAPGELRVLSVSEVSRIFHPNFLAKWRRYFYIFPLNDEENCEQSCNGEEYAGTVIANSWEDINESGNLNCEDNDGGLVVEDRGECPTGKKPTQFSVKRADVLLRCLEGKLLSYKMFARDTKASRNVGPATECFIYHARAVETRLPSPDHVEGPKVMCVELVANRFLRKMVRVLVATTIREAAAGAEDDALLKLMDATCRRATAPPAPPDGLCLADVGYTDFNPQNCLIY